MSNIESLIKGTNAGKIWDEIKGVEIDLFSLPGQTISIHAKPSVPDPESLFLSINSSAVLPAIEAAIQKRFKVELVDKYVVVTRL